jgi:phosphate transport system substrate-binding protein
VKNAQARPIPGLHEFLAELTSEAAIGPAGYLVEKGLVSLPQSNASSLASTQRLSSP